MGRRDEEVLRPDEERHAEDRVRHRSVDQLMTSVALPRRRASGVALPSVAPGVAITYLSVIVLLPLAALLWQSKQGGLHAFWQAVTAPDAVAALKLTLG